MKEQESEWVSISDFMASIVAVLIIFLVAIIIQKLPTKSPISEEEREEKEAKQKITDILKSFGSVEENPTNVEKIFQIDTLNSSINFPNGVFDLGKPCLISYATNKIREVSNVIKETLKKHTSIVIIIEGHADTSRVPNPIPISCAVNSYTYNDNISLSLSRALETRAILIESWNDYKLSERVAVLGYGATKPKKGISDISENRRVVFKFEFQGNENNFVQLDSDSSKLKILNIKNKVKLIKENYLVSPSDKQ